MQEYLTTKPVLEERHRVNFAALEHAEVLRTVVRLQQDLLLPRNMVFPLRAEGSWLFDLCRDHGLDHAAVVFPLCRESDSIGTGAIAKLVGRPIIVWRRPVPVVREEIRLSTGAVVPPRAAGSFSPDMVVMSVVDVNPKKPGSSTWFRFKLWVPGRSVAECMRAGLSRADVLWDIDFSRKFVILGTRAQWEDQQRTRGVSTHPATVQLSTVP